MECVIGVRVHLTEEWCTSTCHMIQYGVMWPQSWEQIKAVSGTFGESS